MHKPSPPAAASLDPLDAYTDALQKLSLADPESCTESLIPVLLARDRVAHHHSISTPASVRRLATLDRQLKDRAVPVTTLVGARTLQEWRKSWHPDANPWWWSLDVEAHNADKPVGVLWTLSIALFVSVSLSLGAEISSRFLAEGPDFFGIFTTISQGLLALLAGATLTTAGAKWVDGLSARYGIRDGRGRAQVKWGLALAVLLALVALRLSLPRIAQLYNNHGVRMQLAGNLSAASSAYRRALRLNPDYVQASYNLATVHEDLVDFDEAIKRYRQAVAIDDRFFAAYNNLARLYITRKADYSGARVVLRRALDLNPDDTAVQYSLHKNLGWAEYRSNHLDLAEAELRHALQFRNDGAGAHCLLAQVLEAGKRSDDAQREFGSCISFARGQEPDVDADWILTATQRIEGALR